VLGVLITFCSFAQPFTPAIPRAWSDADRQSFELPLVRPEFSPRYLSEKEYYALPVRPVYRTYPVYTPDKEPPGYWESLQQKDPEVLFDPATLKTREDWVRAGKLVFEQPSILVPGSLRREEYLESLRQYPGGIPPSGITRNMVYVIRKKGVVEFGVESCAECHTRLMPDGASVSGAPTIEDQGERGLWRMKYRLEKGASFDDFLQNRRRVFLAPWVPNAEDFGRISLEEFRRESSARIPGIAMRHGTGARHPAKTPVLIGIEDLKYLDATGLSHNRGIADVMRYAIVNQGLNAVAHYGDFQPAAVSPNLSRYDDAQLYALALYLYSLKPPPNPHPANEQTRRGAKVFEREACTGCHPAPLYTNNQLTPAKGFRVPAELRATDSVLDVSVGTDPTLAMETRRGTGFYKVPSLRNLWLRSLYGHEGSAASLEEWFDPARLQPNYEPKGYHYGPGPIEGHQFGLRLTADDKAALIAFLRTL
jgi:cytochrome c553